MNPSDMDILNSHLHSQSESSESSESLYLNGSQNSNNNPGPFVNQAIPPPAINNNLIQQNAVLRVNRQNLDSRVIPTNTSVSQAEPLVPLDLNIGFDLNNSRFMQEFITKFRDVVIQKSFCQKLCCTRETDNIRLKKLSELRYFDTKSTLSQFIKEKIPSLKNDNLNSYTILDCYIVCSILEVNSLNLIVGSFSDIMKAISRVNNEAVNHLSSKKYYNNISKTFFVRTWEFWIDSLKNKNINSSEQLKIGDLIKSLDKI